MVKKVTELQKEEMLSSFMGGASLNEISKEFKFTIPTITRQLKKILTEERFLRIKNQRNLEINPNESVDMLDSDDLINHQISDKEPLKKDSESFNIGKQDYFYEITAFNEKVEFENQKDISSKPIIDFSFPKVVYIIVDKKIELEIKYLKDYVEWSFLPELDLDRKTIQIFADQKNAKKFCNKNQKIIKVPDAKLFLKTSKILKSRGISRLIFEDSLISL